MGWIARPCGTGFTGFNEEGPDGLTNRKGAGRTRYLSDVQMKELGEIVETGPDPAVDGVVRWRRIDLKRVIEARFGVIYSERGISRLLGELGFAHISARPQHPRQDKRIIEAFKKNFTDTLQVHIADLPAGTPVEIWFQDEARLGQKNGLTRLWARKGTRPRQPADQRYRKRLSVRRHLSGSRQGGGAHAALGGRASHADASRRDQPPRRPKGPCGCADGSGRMAHHRQTQSPEENLTIILLPSRAPELNPVENIWQYLRANWLSNRVFEDYNAIVDAGCEAWNKLIAQPETITSIGNAKMGPYRSMLNAAGISYWLAYTERPRNGCIDAALGDGRRCPGPRTCSGCRLRGSVPASRCSQSMVPVSFFASNSRSLADWKR